MLDLDKVVDAKILAGILKHGEMVISEPKEDHQHSSVVSAVLIDAPLEDVWDIVADYAKYPEFITLITNAAVEKEAGDKKHVMVKCGFSFMIIKLGVTFRIECTHHDKKKIDFKLSSGELKKLDGQWTFKPVENGKKTILIFGMSAEVRSLGWFAKVLLNKYPIFETPMNGMIAWLALKSIKDRAESRS